MKKKKIIDIGYVVFVIIILLVPFITMSLHRSKELKDVPLSKAPQLIKEKRLNKDLLKDSGAYFNDHFGFRPELINLNAILMDKIFNVSISDQVIVGKNNWLYFGGTLADFQGLHKISNSDKYALLNNLQLINNYVSSKGAKFLFVVAPNKNSIYPENMPYNYIGYDTNSRENILQELGGCGINCVDLFKPLRESDEQVYFEQDSHWNEKGALIGYKAMASFLGLNTQDFDDIEPEKKIIHESDLKNLLFPLSNKKEMTYDYSKFFNYIDLNKNKNLMAPYLKYENPGKKNKILMFRDSFGISLIPFLANSFGKSYFSRLEPYNIDSINKLKVNYLVIEVVERRLSKIIEATPIMETIPIKLNNLEMSQNKAEIKVEQKSNRIFLSGIIKNSVQLGGIYYKIEGKRFKEKIYPAFIIKNGQGDYKFTATIKGVKARDLKSVHLIYNENGINKQCKSIIVEK